MKIWMDVDTCSTVFEQILYRDAERSKVMIVLVGNQTI